MKKIDVEYITWKDFKKNSDFPCSVNKFIAVVNE